MRQLAPAVRSGRQREGLRFHVYKRATERTYSAVEVGRLGALQVDEETSDPRQKMPLEQLAIGARRGRESPAHQPGHDFAQDRSVIFRLRLTRRSLESEPNQVFAQARERPLMQEAGKII